MRRIKTNKLYIDIAISKERFIFRKGNLDGGPEIKVIKFTNLKKDLKQELFSEEFLRSSKETHQKHKLREKEQQIVHKLENLDEKIMGMVLSTCGRYLLLNVEKPRLELWDLTKIPTPKCV